MSAALDATDDRLERPIRASSEARRQITTRERKVRAGLEPRVVASRNSPLEPFSRCGAAERGMGPRVVVPKHEGIQPSLHRCQRARDEDLAQALVLQRLDHALEDGDRAVLTDRAEARLDGVCRTPIAVVTAELRAAIADDVPRRSACGGNSPIEQRDDVGRGCLLVEHGGGDHCAGEVIEHNSDVPGEGPEDRKGERPPGYPEAPSRWAPR
jgi:hypothetical protein